MVDANVESETDMTTLLANIFSESWQFHQTSLFTKAVKVKEEKDAAAVMETVY